jgi:hypothetical protein
VDLPTLGSPTIRQLKPMFVTPLGEPGHSVLVKVNS